MLGLLKELITRNPFVDEVDFSNEGIQYFDPHSVDLLGRFTELKKVSKRMQTATTRYLQIFLFPC